MAALCIDASLNTLPSLVLLRHLSLDVELIVKLPAAQIESESASDRILVDACHACWACVNTPTPHVSPLYICAA